MKVVSTGWDVCKYVSLQQRCNDMVPSGRCSRSGCIVRCGIPRTNILAVITWVLDMNDLKAIMLRTVKNNYGMSMSPIFVYNIDNPRRGNRTRKRFIILFRKKVRMDTRKIYETSALFLLHRFIILQLCYN
jgi:hypothetical protein